VVFVDGGDAEAKAAFPAIIDEFGFAQCQTANRLFRWRLRVPLGTC
jgi:hypothetical protein